MNGTNCFYEGKGTDLVDVVRTKIKTIEICSLVNYFKRSLISVYVSHLQFRGPRLIVILMYTYKSRPGINKLKI